jgi:phage tail-like protein
MAAGRGRELSQDPFASYRFAVIIGNAKEDDRVCGFSEASGLVIETDVETIREGGVNTHEIQLAGPAKFPSRLVLKRGLALAELWSWYKDVMLGKIQRKTVTVMLQDYGGQDAWQWVFSQACPVKWTGPDFRAGSADVAFESIELMHRGLAAEASSSGRLPIGRK